MKEGTSFKKKVTGFHAKSRVRERERERERELALVIDSSLARRTPELHPEASYHALGSGDRTEATLQAAQADRNNTGMVDVLG